MELRITRIDKTLPMPEYKTPGAVAFDVYAREETRVPPKQIGLIPTNFIVCVPEGHVLLLASRSSTPRKKGLMLANGIGIVDQDFCGPGDEMKVIAYNWTDETVTVPRGDRIAQAMLVPVQKCDLIESEPLADKNRGGIGSTG